MKNVPGNISELFYFVKDPFQQGFTSLRQNSYYFSLPTRNQKLRSFPIIFLAQLAELFAFSFDKPLFRLQIYCLPFRACFKETPSKHFAKLHCTVLLSKQRPVYLT